MSGFMSESNAPFHSMGGGYDFPFTKMVAGGITIGTIADLGYQYGRGKVDEALQKVSHGLKRGALSAVEELGSLFQPSDKKVRRSARVKRSQDVKVSQKPPRKRVKSYHSAGHSRAFWFESIGFKFPLFSNKYYKQ